MYNVSTQNKIIKYVLYILSFLCGIGYFIYRILGYTVNYMSMKVQRNAACNIKVL